jgi:hypothetical protein
MKALVGALGWVGLATLLAGCGSKGDPVAPPPIDACFERPGTLPRPPARGLPCELIPPTRQR